MAGETYIVDAVRTPTGRYGGALAGVRPDDLARVVGALLERTPQLERERIDDAYFGNANGAGEENRNVARMAALLAGLPTSVPGATVNRLCGSGMEATVEANRAIGMGDASICIACGVESMSRAPWVVMKPDRPHPHADQTMVSTTLGWRLVNPRMPKEWTVSLGEGAEMVAERYGISREAQDEFAVESHRRAAAAWERGAYGEETVDVPGWRSSGRSRSAPTPRSRSSPSFAPPSARTAPSPRATPRRSTTAPWRCCSPTRRASRRSGGSRWRASCRAG
jgi:acetyl-CoA acetyltransferase family protein